MRVCVADLYDQGATAIDDTPIPAMKWNILSKTPAGGLEKENHTTVTGVPSKKGTNLNCGRDKNHIRWVSVCSSEDQTEHF